MEVYTLDPLLRRERIIDKFESMIWTERWQVMGDFKLTIESTQDFRKLLPTGTRLAINESHRVMEVETYEDITDDDGRKLLKISGRSIEKILLDRVAKDTMGSLTADPKWVLEGNTPAATARIMYRDICEYAQLDAGDSLPVSLGDPALFPGSTIPEPTEPIRWEQEPAYLYDAISSVCEKYDLGMRMYRVFDTGELYFQIYTGIDRTTSQTLYKPVIFAAEFDNLKNTTEMSSIAYAKNVAYVFSNLGSRKVYPLDVDPGISGFPRRVLFLKVDDFPEGTTTASANAVMDQKGKEALAQSRSFSAFDGEIAQTSSYKYGVDYQLGDLVELRNVDRVTNKMRVSEQIFVSDNQGDRSYPTLTINQFVTPGSWLAWNPQQSWSGVDDAVTWGTLP